MLHHIPGPDQKGVLTWRCPRAWASEDIAWEGWEAWLWWQEGQLSDLYAPEPVPTRVIDAVRIVRNAYYRAHQDHDERERRRREAAR